MSGLSWLAEESGRIAEAHFIASPNCDVRPEACAIELIVVHAISLPPGIHGGPGVAQLFTNTLDPAAHPYYREIAGLRVSAHFFIRRDGELLQFVPCDHRAWHAGVSSWWGRQRCNDFSIGIELEGGDDGPFTDRQYRMLNDLLGVLCARYPIRSVVGHEDIAPGRKTDPGFYFEWQRLPALPGVSIRS